MSVTAHYVQTLRDYAAGVMRRAGHHAAQVRAIALALLGGIIWRADPGSIEIKQYDGSLANVLWFSVNGRRYAVAYNHHTMAIEVRDRTQSGTALHTFDNHTPILDVETGLRGTIDWLRPSSVDSKIIGRMHALAGRN